VLFFFTHQILYIYISKFLSILNIQNIYFYLSNIKCLEEFPNVEQNHVVRIKFPGEEILGEEMFRKEEILGEEMFRKEEILGEEMFRKEEILGEEMFLKEKFYQVIF
jgi:hypothetical protein